MDPFSKIKNMKTTVVNKYKENFDVYIGRGTLFGNPYEIGKDGNRLEVIQKYKKWFIEKLKDFEFKKQVLNLKGKKLGCFCKPKLCHGDIIVGYLNRSSKFSNYKVKNIDWGFWDVDYFHDITFIAKNLL